MLKLNCDLGELIGKVNNDALIMPLIDQANIACGFHAGDYASMWATVSLALEHDVTIGAHPSYPDKENFGRISMQLSPLALTHCLHEQLSALDNICQKQNTQISYVKPHGALYNDMMSDITIFEHVCQAIVSYKKGLPLMMQALPNIDKFTLIAKNIGLSLWCEAFADRAYQNNGLLVPRHQPNAVIHDEQEVLTQIAQLIKQQQLTSIDQQLLTQTALI